MMVRLREWRVRRTGQETVEQLLVWRLRRAERTRSILSPTNNLNTFITSLSSMLIKKNPMQNNYSWNWESCVWSKSQELVSLQLADNLISLLLLQEIENTSNNNKIDSSKSKKKRGKREIFSYNCYSPSCESVRGGISKEMVY